MLLTKSSDVIGLVTLTVIGTVLPFSTSGGMSSLTLPVRTGAVPTMLRMAVESVAGVACAGRSVTIGTAPATAAPARPRNWRRVDRSGSRICASLFAQTCEISHDILDLFRRQDRLAAPSLAYADQPLDAIVGRHDGRGIEARRVDQPQPKLAFGPAAARTLETRREVTLKLRFGKWPGVAKDACRGSLQHQRASTRRVTRHARQRCRDRVADDGIIPQSLLVRDAGQGVRHGR